MSPPVVTEPDSPAERDEYAARADLATDFEDLLRWARLSLNAAPIPCVCLDATCERCRVETVVARHT